MIQMKITMRREMNIIKNENKIFFISNGDNNK